ncbi:chaperone protein ClpB1-like [Zingiber officinale]|uniref:chaperone protein ClpB1-like n=1 Tax=Zingiber officinale TaxID=94328 RepID=UPI001C4C424E|nr:chaperone protein ClpB1-like [Zingiber officinale]
MNPDEFTHETNEGRLSDRELTLGSRHGQHTLLLSQALANSSEGAGDFDHVDDIPISTSLVNVIRRAQSLQRSRGDSHLTVDQLFLGLLEDFQIKDLLKDAGISDARVRAEVEKLHGKEERKGEESLSQNGDINFQTLKTYGRDLVEIAREHKSVIDIDSDDEVDFVIGILSWPFKNNPVLVSDLKNITVVEGLAQRIARGCVPCYLLDVHLVALNMSSLIAGVNYHGEFEDRFEAVLKEVEAAKGKVILFVDQIHLVLGAGAMNAAKPFKSTLARGQLRCIGTTTFEDYRKYIEKDAALNHQFQPVYVMDHPLDAMAIIQGLKEKFQGRHDTGVMNQAHMATQLLFEAPAATQLSHCYFNGRHLTDKTIDLDDQAGANVRIQLDSQSEEIENLEKRRIQLEVELHVRKKGNDEPSKARLVEVKKELYDLTEKLQPLMVKYRKDAVGMDEIQKLKRLRKKLLLIAMKENVQWGGLLRVADIKFGSLLEIDALIAKLEDEDNENLEHIATVASRWKEKERLIGLADKLRERVVGQNQAVEAVAEAVLRSSAGLSRPQKPIGSFLFLGPTGVGKTELAKAIAEQLFEDENLLIRIDMSEYKGQHSMARLIGGPPGRRPYSVGHEEAGQLTEAVRRRPYSVVLLDQVDKADAIVLNTLLSAIEVGRLRDGQEKSVDFTNTVIIMTSDLGADDLDVGMPERHKIIMQVEEHFGPDVLNQFDEIVIFEPLSHDRLRKVARLQLLDTALLLAKRGIALGITDAAWDVILSESYHLLYGASPMNPIKRRLAKKVVSQVSEMLIQGMIDENSTVYVDAVPGKKELSYEVKKKKNGGLVDAEKKSDILMEIPANEIPAIRLLNDPWLPLSISSRVIILLLNNF